MFSIGALSNLRWVDHTDHTSLAMLALRAVEPDWGTCVLDLVCVCPIGNRGCAFCGDKTGPKAVVHGRAGVGKGSLSNRVVLRPETESDAVTLGRCDAVRLEDELASLGANSNKMFCCECGASKGGSEDGGEKHYDWLWWKETSSFGN